MAARLAVEADVAFLRVDVTPALVMGVTPRPILFMGVARGGFPLAAFNLDLGPVGVLDRLWGAGPVAAVVALVVRVGVLDRLEAGPIPEAAVADRAPVREDLSAEGGGLANDMLHESMVSLMLVILFYGFHGGGDENFKMQKCFH